MVPMDIHKPDLDAKEFRTSTQARISSSESSLLLGQNATLDSRQEEGHHLFDPV